MVWLTFSQSALNIGIAHCNFCLRGSESDKDGDVRKYDLIIISHSIPPGLKQIVCKKEQIICTDGCTGAEIQLV